MIRRGPSIAALLFAWSGCGGPGASPLDPSLEPEPTPTPTEPLPPVTQEAMAKFPRFLELESGVIRRTCSPNSGVCHNRANYPDLTTAGNAIADILRPCNVRLDDPTQGWDACERRADKISTDALTSGIAWLDVLSPFESYRLALRDPAPDDLDLPTILTNADDNVLLDLRSEGPGALRLSMRAGSRTATLTFGQSSDSRYLGIIEQLSQGDLNRNGVFGAEQSNLPEARLIYPGSLERSYLWRRITGTAPGSRMPLANQPLSSAEYVAIACWIETLRELSTPTPGDTIAYDRCAFGRAPVDFALH
jgi:hypothetical protein